MEGSGDIEWALVEPVDNGDSVLLRGGRIFAELRDGIVGKIDAKTDV